MRNQYSQELYSYKTNELIQNYSWKLKEAELKLFEFVCCCYNTQYYNEETNTIRVSFSDYCKEINVPIIIHGGKDYQDFKKTLQNLRDKSVWAIDKDGNEKLITIINTVKIEPNNKNMLTLYMSDDYYEFLKNKNKNTMIELKIVTNMSSRYSIKLYNLLRSWKGKGRVEFSLEYLKENLDYTKKTYNNITLLKKSLDFAVNEINKLSPLFVSYTVKRTKNKITDFVFNIYDESNDSTGVDYNGIVQEVNEQIEYKKLKADWLESPYVDVARDVIVDVYKCTNDFINISNYNYPTSDVQEVFKKIKYSTIDNILRKIDEVECKGNKITSAKAYIKTILYFDTLQQIQFEKLHL